MATIGCGCKICKAELGEYTNQLINDGVSPKEVIKILLKESKLKITESLLKKHLSAFSIPYPDLDNDEKIKSKPVNVDLNKIDFSEYDFDITNPESIVTYLQKINLKIYLHQAKITLQVQKNVIAGEHPDMPKEVMQNLALAYQILEKSAGLGIRINQQEAIKLVESMGFILQSPNTILIPSNVQNKAESETVE